MSKTNGVPVIGILLGLLLVFGSVLSQAPKTACFSGTLPSKKVIAGDTLTIDLDSITKLDNAQFKFISDAKGLTDELVQLPYTFFPNGVDETLTQDFTKCDAMAPGLTDGDFVFLCDSTKLLFLSIESHSGKVLADKTSILDLKQGPQDNDLQCDTVRGDAQNNVYIPCKKRDMNILIYTVNLNEKKVNPPFLVEQPSDKMEQTITRTLKLSVDSFDTQTHFHITLFLYERSPVPDEARPRFIMLEKPKPEDSFKNLGYFGSGNEEKVKDLANGKINTILSYGTNVLLVLKNQEDKYLVQRCGRQLVEGVFTCLPETTVMESTTDSVLKIYPVDASFKTTKAMDVYTVTKNQITQGTLDPDTPKYERVNQYNIKTALTTVTDVQRTEEAIFVFGPTAKSEGKDIVDGVVKFKVKSKAVQETSYFDVAGTWAMSRTNPYDIRNADLIYLSKQSYSSRLVQKTMAIISTSTWKDDQLKRVEFTVQCTDPKAPDNVADTTKFVLETLLTTSQDAKVTLKAIDAYAGSVFFLGSTSDEAVVGNAPKLVKTTYDPADSKVELKFETAALFSNPELTGITGVTNFDQIDYLGDSIYVLSGKTSAIFVKCLPNDDETNAKCEKVYTTIDLETDNLRFLKAEITHGILTYLLGSAKDQNPRTVLNCLNLNNEAKPVFEPFIVNFWTDFAEIKLLGSHIYLFIVGGETEKDAKELRYIKFQPEYLEPAHVFTPILKFQSHVCPTGLSWTPRKKATMFIASSCESAGTDSHVYQVKVDYENPSQSRLVETVLIQGTRKFSVCAQDSVINIINYDRHIAYSINRYDTGEMLASLPFQGEFGVSKIRTHYCSQEDNALQIVGCDESAPVKCKLVTYRANLIDEPRRRVHSVIDVRNDIKQLASSYNYKNDDALTLLMSTDVLTAVWSQLDGPHLLYSAKNLQEDKKIVSTPTIRFQGAAPADGEAVTQTLNLVLQSTELQAKLKDPKKKPVMDNTAVELDDFLNFTGPYHKLTAVAGLAVKDRIPPSTLFDGVKTVWKDSILHRDYVFGYQKKTDGDHLLLAQNDVVKSGMGSQGYSIRHLQAIAISADEFYFFALGSKPFMNDRIICIFTVDGGQKFEVARLDLPSPGYQQSDIRKLTNGGWFLFGGYDNEVDYTTTALAFKINKDGTENHGKTFESHFRENIVDFELVPLEKNRAVMITALQYDSHADFHLIEVDDKGEIKLISKQISTITPLFEEAHREVVFKCKEGIVASANFTCLMTGLNMHSYISTFSLTIKDNHAMNEPFIKSKVTSKLRNIVNLSPIKADFFENHVAILVKNDLPLDKPITKETPARSNSFFQDSHLVLVYKIDQSDPSMPIERDVYRILDSTDLGVAEKQKLSSLDPHFFRGVDNKLRLGINIGLETKSIKAFGLDGLIATLDKSKAEHKELSLKFVALDSREFPIKTADVFEITSTPTEKKNPLLMLTIIAVVVLIVGIVIAGIFYTRHSPTSGMNYEEGLDDVEKSMRNNEDSVGDGYKRA